MPITLLTSVVLLLTGCASSSSSKFQSFLDEIDYQSIGDIQEESQSTILDNNPFASATKPDYKEVVYRANDVESLGYDITKVLNEAGAQCPEPGDISQDCEGIDGLNITLREVGSDTGYDSGIAVTITNG